MKINPNSEDKKESLNHKSVASVEDSAGATDCVAKKPKLSKRTVTAYITKIAVLSALATVLYMFAKFPIFPVPPFNVLDMNFADIPALLGGFAMGPVAACIITLIRCTIKLATTTTVFVGELSNFIVSISFVLPASIIYKYRKNIKGALIGLAVGVVMNAIVGILCNYFIAVPLYAKLFSPALMEVRNEFTFIYGLSLNAIKSVVASVITFILYKRLSKILHL